MRTVLVALVFCGSICAAPAPEVKLPKAAKNKLPELLPKDLVGIWQMDWGGGLWATRLYANGDYVAISKSGTTYVGTWFYQNELFVLNESMLYENDVRGPIMTSRVRFQKDEKGFYHRLSLFGVFLDSDGEPKLSPTFGLKR